MVVLVSIHVLLIYMPVVGVHDCGVRNPMAPGMTHFATFCVTPMIVIDLHQLICTGF
jgi:hypothetical protein